MSLRGRGGRGGSRGGSASKSLNREQLTALGVGSNELVPGPVTQPPPLYPMLLRHPVQLTPSSELNYLLILKQDFLDQLHLSASYLKMPVNRNNQPEQEIDKLVAQLPNVKEQYDWNLFPSELRPKVLAKRVKKNIVKEINIQDTLTKLEKIEAKTEDDDVAVSKDLEDDDGRKDDEIELRDDDMDEEMDDGTDYANNYFDNGEDYEEEDDKLEDGPIY